MTALTIGITTARFAECKRGLAVNVAASLARDPARGRVCVVDADPLSLDVTTRFAVRGPYLEDFADAAAPAIRSLGSVHEPPLAVVPSAGASLARTLRATERALPHLRAEFDVVVCDLVGGAAGPARVVGRRAPLDWLLIAVTPDVEPVQATASFLDRIDDARRQGEIAPTLRIGIVLTGDEGSVGATETTDLRADVVEKALGRPVVGSVHQLWGRAAPNLGFGAALGIAELDDAVAALYERLAAAAGRTEPAFSYAP